MEISAVIPIFNERQNVALLYDRLAPVLDGMGRNWEMILVDDGSTDGSGAELEALARRDGRVKLITFRRNYGQTAAMQAGIQHATGNAIVTLDGDLQNEPADIPLLVAKLDEGYDLAHGWRQNRQDTWITRRLPSQLANWLISRVTQFPVHDLGCTLKAMRREIGHELELYGEMHRFIPILAHARGARCVEVVTRHHPRRFGQSKSRLSRTLRVLLDLLTITFLSAHLASPLKWFGKWGLACAALGGAGLLGASATFLLGGAPALGWTLLSVGSLATFAGMQLVGLGLLAELTARLYFSATGRKNYDIRRTVNFEEAASHSGELRMRAA